MKDLIHKLLEDRPLTSEELRQVVAYYTKLESDLEPLGELSQLLRSFCLQEKSRAEGYLRHRRD